ncbi:hypothetical protein PGT21_015714 [Puccinia graminis f. sp. tritici]|uniref:Myb/SANT-like domain-containing protein n=1 Tax=Puccinia graminis f. sp. tritici TaxID=56615 RepID=A0A5B0QAD3_PUCGR|nr:hypothetical protein PGT21_015714 [Puccinia graminis f. sp. tritici]
MPRGRKEKNSQPILATQVSQQSSAAHTELLSLGSGTTGTPARTTHGLQPSLATPSVIDQPENTPPNSKTGISSQNQPPNSETRPEGTNSQNQPEGDNSHRKNLVWTPAMEKSALDLYVKAVEEGKRCNNGFKPETHRWVATELSNEFPGSEFTGPKVKSKLNQTFKKWYDAFVACKEASGFGWNEDQCMVTASEEVWSSFLVSHPTAKRFKNTPFPEFHELNVIVSGNAAVGALCKGTNAIEAESNQESPPDAINNGQNLPSTASQEVRSARPGVRPPRKHRISSGDRFENTVERLIDAFISQDDNTAQTSTIHRAIEKFQDHFAEGLDMDDMVAGFSILENEAKANTFLAIRDHTYCQAWLNRQIQNHHSTTY